MNCPPTTRLQALLLLLACHVASARAACMEPEFFEPAVTFNTGPFRPSQIVARDFNGDGRLDLAVGVGLLHPPGGRPDSIALQPAVDPGSVAILLATGPGSFAEPVHLPAPLDPLGLVSGDFNSDGIADLAAASTFARKITVYLGQGSGGIGDGTFAAGVSYDAGASAFHLVAADLDRDGILDLVTCSDEVPAVAVFRGLGSGGAGTGAFAAPVAFPTGGVSTGIVAADFNGDEVLDLALTVNLVGAIAVLPGTSDPVLGPSFAFPTHIGTGLVLPFAIETADFDTDGRVDLAVASVNGGGVNVMRGDGTGGFTAVASIASGTSSSVAARDVNHDGIEDLVVAQGAETISGSVDLYLGQGAGGVWNGSFGLRQPFPITGNPYQLVVADLEGDGRWDVVASEYFGESVSLLQGTCLANVGVPVESAAALALRGPRPNPARSGILALSVSLGDDGPATLEVLDAAGRRVCVQSLAGLPAGDHVVRFEHAVSLAPGVYVARLLQAGRIRQGKVVLTR